MIDIHSHIIWGIDDGSQDIQMSEQMARVALENGITDIIATPHFRCGDEKLFELQELTNKIDMLNKHLVAKGINVKIHVGMEIFVSNDLPDTLKKGTAIGLANSGYILMELPFSEVPFFTYNLVYSLILEGYIPIIAHPERNRKISEDMGILQKLVDMGCYTQINKGSIMGDFGHEPQKTALKLLEEGLVHCIGTDMHNTDRRNPSLIGLKEKLSKTISEEKINILLYENPNKVLQNSENLVSLEAKQKKSNKMIWWKKLLIAAAIIGVLLISAYYYVLNKSVTLIMDNLANIEVQNIELVLEESQLSENPDDSHKISYNDNFNDVGANQNTNQNANQNTNQNKTKATDLTERSSNKADSGSDTYEGKANTVQNANKQKFTEADKRRILKIVYGKISSAEVDLLRNLAKDGFSSGELKKARELLAPFTQAEKTELKSLYAKYHNSQKSK